MTEEAKRLESNRSHDVGAHHALRSIRAAKVRSAAEYGIVFAFESAGGSSGGSSSRSGNGSSSGGGGGSGWRRSRAGAAGDGIGRRIWIWAAAGAVES